MKLLLRLALLALLAVPVTALAGACDTPQAAQFDFWIGIWDVSNGGKIVGRNEVAKIQDGCTVTEDYHSVNGPYTGRSFNWFDPVSGRWHQVWVDSGGTRLMLSGGLDKEGRMVLEGERTVNGTLVTDRITWTPNDNGTVRQHWEQSPDGGISWGTIFDGIYTKAQP